MMSIGIDEAWVIRDIWCSGFILDPPREIDRARLPRNVQTTVLGRLGTAFHT
jgi:hypothetical protein